MIEEQLNATQIVDSDDRAIAFGSVLQSSGFKTRFVCSLENLQSGTFDDVYCEAFIFSEFVFCEWIAVTKENLSQILDGTYKKPKTVLFHLDSGDRVIATDGRMATVQMIYFDARHTGSSEDLINLVFEDGTSRRCYSTDKYIATKLPKS